MGLMSPGVSWLLTSRRATGLVSTVALLSTSVVIVAPATKIVAVVVASVVVAVVVAVVVIVVIIVISVVTAVITMVVLAISS